MIRLLNFKGSEKMEDEDYEIDECPMSETLQCQLQDFHDTLVSHCRSFMVADAEGAVDVSYARFTLLYLCVWNLFRQNGNLFVRLRTAL